MLPNTSDLHIYHVKLSEKKKKKFKKWHSKLFSLFIKIYSTHTETKT